jgi:hypothetical protein
MPSTKKVAPWLGTLLLLACGEVSQIESGGGGAGGRAPSSSGSCVNACTASGDTRCADDYSYEICQPDATGCFRFSRRIACVDETPLCDPLQGRCASESSFCLSECAGPHDKRCDGYGDTYRACIDVGGGCYKLAPTSTPCPSATPLCDGNACVAATPSGDCVPTCTQLGLMYCITTTQYKVCQDSDPGPGRCLQFSERIACPSEAPACHRIDGQSDECIEMNACRGAYAGCSASTPCCGEENGTARCASNGRCCLEDGQEAPILNAVFCCSRAIHSSNGRPICGNG